MTKEGAARSLDLSRLLVDLFTLLPIPVAIADGAGEILLSNSAFNETCPGVRNLGRVRKHEAGSPVGTWDLEVLPLNGRGMSIVYGRDVTKEGQLRNQVVHLEKMAAIGRLVTGIAHELNNPLAGILGYSQLVAKSNLDEATRQKANIIVAQAERAGRIVENVLSLAARTEPQRIVFDLNAVIGRVLLLREYEQRLANISVSHELAEDLPSVVGDPGQIEQVILNLVINAEDAVLEVAARAGQIHIRTYLENDRVHLSVTDNGSGIHARNMARIFDPFFTTKTKGAGTGLGLSICAELVKAHGGELYAWSTYGAGSTFTAELPVRVGECPAVETPRSIPDGIVRGKRILVIDDEISMTGLLEDILTDQGASVDAVNSGMDAMELLQANNYDLIICDLRMPGLNGRRLFKLVQSSHPDLESRFLFVTGEIAEEPSHRTGDADSVRYLRKPFRINDLLGAIAELVQPAT